MFGKNPIRPPENGDGLKLQVQEIFPTVQGEGPNTGVPSVFVRLGGCNLACDFCDTEFESFIEMSVDEILHEVCCLAEEEGEPPAVSRQFPEEKIKKKGGQQADRSHEQAERRLSRGQETERRQLIVITGGEPLRQNIVPLCEVLLEEGFTPQIETNGTLWRDLPQGVEVICSPKASNGTYHALRPDLLERITALKFVISKAHEPYTLVPDIADSLPIWVQPMNEYNVDKNKANLEYALELAERHGYKVSLQTHKIFELD